MARIVFDPAWERHLDVPIDDLMEHLGSEVETDAKGLAPVNTGRLRDSIDHEVSDQVARIGSNVDYAIDVEEGHRIVAWGHDTGRHKEADPFLKPALYTPRSA